MPSVGKFVMFSHLLLNIVCRMYAAMHTIRIATRSEPFES